MVGEQMRFDLCCVKPRVGETSQGTAETPGFWGPLVTNQCVLQTRPSFASGIGLQKSAPQFKDRSNSLADK